MTSINAKNIETWFTEIMQGQLVLPRFQRHPAWRDDQVGSLFENILRKPSLPIGVLLILDVGDEQPFRFRPIDGAPEASPRPRMHLLDGQQRMTAIWKALTNGHERARFFIDLSPPEGEHLGDEDVIPAPETVVVKRISVRDKKGDIYPRWISDPAKVSERNYIPLSLLRPGNEGEKEAEEWVEAASPDLKSAMKLQGVIAKLRSRVASYSVPYLELDKRTSQDTALDVFINMNTSATPLKAYDIVVAQHEGVTGESLHDRLETLKQDVPGLSRFDKVDDLMLSVAALVMGRPPIKKTFLTNGSGKITGFAEELENRWLSVETAFRRGIDFLQREGIFGSRFVPNDSALQLAIALWGDIPEGSGDKEGNAREIIRNVFWRGCLTDRYGKTSATRSFADFGPLYKAIHHGADPTDAQLFDADEYPVVDIDDLVRAGWPKTKNRIPRSVLALSLRTGGLDFSDGSPASPASFNSREYHHVFPVAALGHERDSDYVNRSLNCAYITWQTNRRIGAKTPSDYIQGQANAANLGEDAVRQRLESHLIPYDALIAGDYKQFLQNRAERVMREINNLLTIEPRSLI